MNLCFVSELIERKGWRSIFQPEITVRLINWHDTLYIGGNFTLHAVYPRGKFHFQIRIVNLLQEPVFLSGGIELSERGRYRSVDLRCGANSSVFTGNFRGFIKEEVISSFRL